MSNNTKILFVLVAITVMIFPDLVFATATSGTSWDTPLTKIRDAITGPIAYTISILAIVVSGAMLAFGGELNEFARRMIMLILVVALVMLAIEFLSNLWGTTGTEIAALTQIIHYIS